MTEHHTVLGGKVRVYKPKQQPLASDCRCQRNADDLTDGTWFSRRRDLRDDARGGQQQNDDNRFN